MADPTVSIVKEECFLDEILQEFPNKVAKPTPTVKPKNVSFSKLFHQFSDSLKDLDLLYTCVDASSVVLALGTNVGNAFIYQRNHKKIVKISSDTKYVPTTCIKLAAGCGMVAFGHETGTFSVGLVDPPIQRTFESLTAQDTHLSTISCLEWSTDGLIVYAGDSNGKISMSVVKISEAILQTAIIIEEDADIVQLSYANDALLASTGKRTIIWPFQTENITQVGEKERKTVGCFGCCFIPDNLQEPSKKLYTARPGQRIWTADESGKVSSTSVFKTLLADKPQKIYTLTGNDKINSGGQFGQLLIYYDKFVVTWDQSHLWILDLQEGIVVGCHSNLGKIRDVTVSGHELFVLVNQRERFLRRFTLVNEKLGPSSIDAVIAVHEGVAKTSPEISQKIKDNRTDSNVVLPPSTVLETEVNPGQEKEVDPPLDVFQRINSIPLDCEKGDIVFTGAKRKKKKKKVKEASISNEAKTRKESQDNEEKTDTALPSGPKDESSVEFDNERVPSSSGSVVLEQSSKETTKEPGECNKSEIQERSSVLPSRDDTALLIAVHDKGTSRDQQVNQSRASTGEGAETSPELNEALTARDEQNSEGVRSNQQADTLHTQTDNDVVTEQDNVAPDVTDHGKKIVNVLECGQEDTDVIIQHDKKAPCVTVHSKEVTDDTIQHDKEGAEAETFLSLKTSSPILPEKVEPNLQNSPVNNSGVFTESENKITTPDLHESLESGDEFQMLEESSNYLRSDSYEVEKAENPNEVRARKESEDEKPDEDFRVPSFADTWSRREVPTVYNIESLAISEKYVFCVDAQSNVYYSDPSSASCHGWEQLDFKATRLCVNSSSDFITFLGPGNKAFIRGNASAMYPFGKKSFQIMEDVTNLATCSTCSWAVTTNGGLRRAESSTLLGLKGDLKNSKIWRKECPCEKLCQIACYDDVLWGRTVDETLLVYAEDSSGKKTTWKKVEEKKAKWINISEEGTVWIITPSDHIWFNSGVSRSSPIGEAWYQVTLGQYLIDDPSILDSTVNFFQSMGSAYRNARTAEYLRNAAKGLIQSTKDMACSLFRDGGYPKQVCCNMQSGVWLLDTKNTLHACRGQVTGAYWERVCPTGTAQSATWRQVSTGLGSYVWALQPNGELTCFNPKGPSYNVEGPSAKESLDFISSSPHGVWCFASKNPGKIYVRDGISESYPHGFAWVSLKLSDQVIQNVKHLSVGAITVWAVDNTGNLGIRIGSVSGDQSTVLSQAWLPIEGPPHAELDTVEVNAKDTMVWVTDTKGKVYARDGIKEDFLIGHSWREVSGALLKGVCLTSSVVYGLCTNGEIVCRFGVSASNYVGDYWKKIPGHFARISVNKVGELWGVNGEEQLFLRKTKYLLGKLAVNEAEKNVMEEKKDDVAEDVDVDGDWELL